ncbi:lysostaphin resistance A-like protein [Luteibacter sp. CQ10]|uniref:lysostaphin resistance A-like protein n=1 Tax=Luteibacter sp. CQ10 TaxID=2805821 RepID=UPI0034A48BDE
MRKPFPGGDIAWFIVWLIAFSAPVSAFIVHLGTQPPMMSRMLMWCPGAAALATCVTRKRDVRSLGWTWPRLRYIGWGYVIPFLYAIPVYAIAWMLIPDAFQWSAYAGKLAHDFQVTSHATAFAAFFGIPTTMVFIVISGMAWALGEEIGWRGFLVPRLYERLGFTGTSLASGALWSVWHYPSLLGADYNAGTTPAYAVACFTVMAIGMSFVMTWLRMASGSLWPCVVLHASHNTIVQTVLDPMTATDGRAPYVTTEFGAGMAIVLTMVAVSLALHQRGRPIPAS